LRQSRTFHTLANGPKSGVQLTDANEKHLRSKETRFQPNSHLDFEALKGAADAYPRQLTDVEKLGFVQKPLDWHKGHPNYLNNMFQLLNGIQAMGLEAGSTIVEVGSGAGWATEILAGLKYRVVCLEPAWIMLEAAKQRVDKFLEAHAMSELTSNIGYHCVTLEEFELPPQSADAVLFFESFHHVIDEHSSVRQVARVLRPGGVLCILGDSNWIPGLKAQEDFWVAEMERFGTLESPFTHAYLTELLSTYGFVDIRRHHGVNALVPVERENEPARNFAGNLDAKYVNLFTARRPSTDLNAPRTS
jgi:SAM-dependent methyltransferase